MVIDVFNENERVQTVAAAVPSINSLNKKLQWLLEVEKAYIDNQNEGVRSMVSNTTDIAEANKLDQGRGGELSDANLVNHAGAELSNAAQRNDKAISNAKVDNLKVDNHLALQINQLKNTAEQSTSKAIDLLELLKKPLIAEKTGYFNSSKKLNPSKEFIEVMSDFSENKMHDSVKLFTGADGVQIVIKCEKSLSHSYTKMGHDIKHLLENRGNKVNSLIINGKTLWSGHDANNLSHSEFSVIY